MRPSRPSIPPRCRAGRRCAPSSDRRASSPARRGRPRGSSSAARGLHRHASPSLPGLKKSCQVQLKKSYLTPFLGRVYSTDAIAAGARRLDDRRGGPAGAARRRPNRGLGAGGAGGGARGGERRLGPGAARPGPAATRRPRDPARAPRQGRERPGAHHHRARRGVRPHRRARRRRRRLPGEALRPGRALGARARGVAPARGALRLGDAPRSARARYRHAPRDVEGQGCRALGARIRTPRGARRSPRRLPHARAARGAPLRLGGGDREQRGGSAHPRAEEEARSRRDPQRARHGLHDRRGRRLMSMRRRLLFWLLSSVLAGGLAAAAGPTLMPFAVARPLMGFLIWGRVGREVRFLESTAQAGAKRSPESLEPIGGERVPEEIQPLVGALNALLARLGGALAHQRQFIADAAHELRTPLTALRLQLQLAERARDEAEREKAHGMLREGIARAVHLVEQLLTLARQDPEASMASPADVDIAQLARAIVEAEETAASHKALALGASAAEPVVVRGDRAALRALIENLVDNALRYTPSGTVAVRAYRQGGEGILEVEDSGPGIPEGERVRVFDRFYRGEAAAQGGSGLGLAIVRRIAERHGGTVELLDPAAGRGLLARVKLPLKQGAALSPA